MRILIAENDTEILEVTSEMLRLNGNLVFCVTTCNEAITLLRTEQWDLLLSDLLFVGRQDGLDLADKAAAQGVRSIIMSGAMDRREEVEAHGLRFLPKPFRYATLLTTIGSDAHNADRTDRATMGD